MILLYHAIPRGQTHYVWGVINLIFTHAQIVTAMHFERTVANVLGTLVSSTAFWFELAPNADVYALHNPGIYSHVF